MAGVLPASGWYKSSYSVNATRECVEVARAGTGVQVRDSKDPSGPVLTFDAQEWAAFLSTAIAARTPTTGPHS